MRVYKVVNNDNNSVGRIPERFRIKYSDREIHSVSPTLLFCFDSLTHALSWAETDFMTESGWKIWQCEADSLLTPDPRSRSVYIMKDETTLLKWWDLTLNLNEDNFSHYSNWVAQYPNRAVPQGTVWTRNLRMLRILVTGDRVSAV